MLKSEEKIYLVTLFFTMAISSVVKWEPAVFDILMVILFLWGVAKRYFSRPPRTILWPGVLLLILAMTNIFYFTHYSELSNAIHFSTITFYCMFLWYTFTMLLNYFQKRGFHYLLYGYATSALLSALIGTLAYTLAFSTDLLFYRGYRLEGFFKDPNVFGPFMVPIIIVSLIVMLGANVRNKWFWYTSYVVCTIGLLLSFSRAAYLNLGIAGLVLAGLLWASKTTINRKGAVMIVSGSLVILLFIGFLSMRNEIHGDHLTFEKTLVQRAGYQKYDNERFNGQEKALQLSLNNPWGIGPGQSSRTIGIDTHNTFLRVSVENGWLGLLGLIGFLGISIYRSFQLSVRKDTPMRSIYICTTAILLGIIANSLFIDTLHWRHFWLFLALAWVDFNKDPDGLGWY